MKIQNYILAALLMAPFVAVAQPTPVAPATQAEVNAGTIHTKFVAPDTLAGYSGSGGPFVLKANNGSDFSSKRNTSGNIALQVFSTIGGGFPESDFYTATPAYEGQIGSAYSGAKTMYMYVSGSTTVGDWKHGWSWPGGYGQIGDDYSMDPFITGHLTVNFHGNPALWNTTGSSDGSLVVRNWRRSPYNSGSGLCLATMGDGFGISAVAVAAAGSGYTVNDTLTVAGGTISGAGFGGIVRVTSVNGSGGITGVAVHRSGEFTVSPSSPNSVTGGSGSGATITLTMVAKGVRMQPDAAIGFMHQPLNRVAQIQPGNCGIVVFPDSTHDKSFSVSRTQAASLDSGNYSFLVCDFVNDLFVIPKWVAGCYQPGDTKYSYTVSGVSTYPAYADLYSHNGHYYTILSGGAGTITAVGQFAPLASGTFTKVEAPSGTPDSTITFSANSFVAGFDTALSVNPRTAAVNVNGTLNIANTITDLGGSGLSLKMIDGGEGGMFQFNVTAGGDVGYIGKASGLRLVNAGQGINIKEGSNARMGTLTLNGATEVTVNTTKVTASSRIFLTIQAPGGTPAGVAYVSSRAAGTSFGVKGVALDTSTVAWMIVEPL